MQHEFARTAEDVLWRRSKLGLTMAAVDQEALARFMASNSKPS
jgi:glycerol-3-phosphate dehydrogenase